VTTFADSSAIVKRYADEEHADLVRDVGVLVVSQLALVEVPAALWRKSRVGELSPEHARTLTTALDVDVAGGALVVVAMTDGIVARAADLAATHPLRAYDAVQLATAIAVRDADPSCTTFACFDVQLRRAAAHEGFRPLT